MDVRRLTRFALPALLLCCFAWEKANLNPTSSRERQADGIYYFQIAQHVANGDGLRTSVSLYGQGLRDMPAPATVQPRRMAHRVSCSARRERLCMCTSPAAVSVRPARSPRR